ncbi:hypothetical protein ABT187_29780 [Streptomyces sp. NPDC001817]|uniref:hypothetical protein n=1 Tax=Streptomyces sp. NPDC001817 TaxID=3154398 RepID=UPI00331CC943
MLSSYLLTAACAVLAGARSYLAIGQWARNARRMPSLACVSALVVHSASGVLLPPPRSAVCSPWCAPADWLTCSVPPRPALIRWL